MLKKLRILTENTTDLLCIMVWSIVRRDPPVKNLEENIIDDLQLLLDLLKAERCVGFFFFETFHLSDFSSTHLFSLLLFIIFCFFLHLGPKKEVPL